MGGHKVEMMPQEVHQKTVPQKKITLNQWIESKMPPTASNESMHSTIALSRFGLKTAEDVKKFLHSPAGEVLVGEIGQEIEREEAIEEQLRFEEREHRLLILRIKALLFLWFLEEKTDARDKINEIILKIKELIKEKQHQEHIQESESKSHKTMHYELAIKQYEDTLSELQDAIKEGEYLEQRMLHLEKQRAQLDDKYSIFERILDEDAHEDLTPPMILSKIEALTEEIEQHIDQIQALIESNQDDKAHGLRNKHNGLNLKVAHLRDMLATHEGTKYYANAAGEHVSSPRDADFILNLEQKIIQHDGKYYLLNNNQDWDSVKESPEALVEAQKHYEQSKQELMTIKKVVLHHKTLETEIHQEQVDATEQLLKHNLEYKAELAHKINTLHTMQINAPQTTPNMELHAPSAGIGAPSITPKPSPTPQNDLTPDKLIEKLRALKVESQFIQTATALLANTPRSTPIPTQMMQTLLQNIPALQQNSDAAIVSPEPEDHSNTYTTPRPTPFKTDI